jgi:Rrf2 family protein
VLISQKCQYALRAIFELARRYGEGPVKIADVAEAQAIPPRFLEVILSQLKQGGFTASQRGARGGYMLAREPDELTVGEIVRFVEGPIGPVTCAGDGDADHCRFQGDCVFLPMWERVREAMSGVYDTTTFSQLVEEYQKRTETYVPSYTI